MSQKVIQPRIPRWRSHPRQKRSRRRPTLRFSPTAWAQLLFLRDRGPTEVGGFGIADPDDLLFVEEIELVSQRCTQTFVAFDDVAVAEFFDKQIDQNRRPEQFARIWVHSHPGESAQPSFVDRETFNRVFGRCDWAVMFIIACGGATSAELHWRHGGPASIPLNIEIDFSRSFPASDAAAWAAEYDAKVRLENLPSAHHGMTGHPNWSGRDEDRNKNFPSDQRQPFVDDSLANFCQHPLAWEMA